MSPAGWPGFALLVLRVAVTASVLLNAHEPDLYKPDWQLFSLLFVAAAVRTRVADHLPRTDSP
jgi:hypothetical protein